MIEIKTIIQKRKRDFNASVALIGVIPFLVFIYLLVVRVASLHIFVGEVGYIMLATLAVFLLGIFVGRKMLWSLLQEIIERNRLVAVTETTLSLSHEINNPLLTVAGNLELLEGDLLGITLPEKAKSRINTIKEGCERIRNVTEKMAKLHKPVSTTIHGGVSMIDAEASA